MINFQSESDSLPSEIDNGLISWIERVILSHNCKCGELNYFFCSDEYILQTNRDFLNHDYYTDIITFDNCIGNIITGDLVISLDTVKSNSVLLSIDYTSELHRVIIHGILHLIGFKDASDDDKRVMRQQEDAALKLLPTFL
ncbi:rRNA maturation RNase YbeY [Carboxylicivirga sp. N1Y90]|uniref:rRNA maturation RNase YbeY n=1 Tax=Carboxylicivirga fragile TaxID=3417571 RepID=UPI003D348A67|nr:rRNA maturation RNase YbeY [Marinilabiliaceae bacterium N1Y90]